MDFQKLLAERWKQADAATKAKCAGLRLCCDHGGQRDISMGCLGQVRGHLQAKQGEVRRGDAGVHRVLLEQGDRFTGRAQMRPTGLKPIGGSETLLGFSQWDLWAAAWQSVLP
jgi:hypothetical protein